MGQRYPPLLWKREQVTIQETRGERFFFTLRDIYKQRRKRTVLFLGLIKVFILIYGEDEGVEG